jgi:hypothetical protein
MSVLHKHISNNTPQRTGDPGRRASDEYDCRPPPLLLSPSAADASCGAHAGHKLGVA